MNHIRIARRKGLKDLFALFVAILMVFWMSPIGGSQAAFSAYSVTMSSSSPAGTGVTYDVLFTPSTTTKIDTVLVKFCEESGGYFDTCTAITGMAFTNSSSTITDFGDNSNTLNAITFSTNILTVDISGSTNEIVEPHRITAKNFTNPSAQVMYARVASFPDDTPTTGEQIDEGSIGMVVIADVEISGTQTEALTVIIAANTTEEYAACQVSEGAIDATATATTVPFEEFKTAIASTIASQRVRVDTNSGAGYTVKAMTDQLLTSGSNTIPGPTSLSGNDWNEATSYGFGICAAGDNAGGTYSEAYENPTTQRTLFTYGSPVSLDYTYVFFRVAVEGTQEPGTYTSTMNYVVTPMY